MIHDEFAYQRGIERRIRQNMLKGRPARLEQARRDFPEAVEILESGKRLGSFIEDVRRRFQDTGKLSEKQAAIVVKVAREWGAKRKQSIADRTVQTGGSLAPMMNSV